MGTKSLYFPQKGPIFWHRSGGGNSVTFAALASLAILLLALFLGLAIAILPWQFVIVGVGMPILLITGLVYPLVVFGAGLLLMFGIVPEFLMTALPLGGARIRPPELMLIFLFVIICFRVSVDQEPYLVLLAPVRWLIIVLLLGLLLGLVRGRLFASNQLAFADARQFVGWLALPITLWFMQKQPTAMVRLVVGISVIAGLLMMGQFVFGVKLIYGFRGAENLSSEFSDIMRSAIGGGLFLLVFTSYYLYLRSCHSAALRWLYLIGSIICLGGIVVSFNRAVWAGFLLGGALTIILKPKTKNSQAVSIIALISILLLSCAGVLIFKPRAAEAVYERVASIMTEGRRGSSLGFRFDENQQALTALRKNPVLGVGLGGEYKQVFRQQGIGGGFDTESSYIHNGYLSLWLKLGIFGLLLPIFIMAAVVLMYRRLVVKVEDTADPTLRIFGLPALATVAMMFVSAVTSPDWSTLGQCSVLGILLAIIITQYARVRVIAGSKGGHVA